MEYDNPDNPYEMEGYFNAENVVEALEFYRELYECCTPPGWADAYMQENLDAYTSGQVAMVATKGRASYLGERSAGHLDPGAASSRLLIQTVCDVIEG